MKSPKILIIEDNPLNLELATDLLECAGCTVHSSCTAEGLLSAVKACLPDLVLMDLNLPGLDGLAATRLLKTTHHTRNLPVVAVTAHAMNCDRDEAIQAGCDGYVTKPIDTRSFVSTILGFLPDTLTTNQQN